jgi:hypothetical protein
VNRHHFVSILTAFVIIPGCFPDSAEQKEVDGPPFPDTASTSVQSDTIWTVSVTGFGPIRVGQSTAEVEATLVGGVELPEPLDDCGFISLSGWLEGVFVMVVDGRVARIDVRDGPTATLNGARIGSTESEILDLYPGQVEEIPHKYTDGNYLNVTPLEATESEYRVIFETDGEKVERYRAGILPAVEWVEGCG